MPNLILTLIKQAIAINRLVRDSAKAEQQGTMALHGHLARYGVIQLQVGAGAGNTSSIRELARPGDLVITNTMSPTSMKHWDSTKNGVRWVEAVPFGAVEGMLFEEQVQGDYNTIWIDDAAKVFYRIPAQRIIRHLARNHEQTFIILGNTTPVSHLSGEQQ